MMSTHYDLENFYEPSEDFPYDKLDFDYDKLDGDDILNELPPALQYFVKMKIQNEIQDTLSKIISIIYDSTDYRLKIATLVMAFGLPMFMGKSQTQVAKKHGVTKQALSKSIKKMQKLFGLTPTRGQKSEKACEKYRQLQLDKNNKKI